MLLLQNEVGGTKVTPTTQRSGVEQQQKKNFFWILSTRVRKKNPVNWSTPQKTFGVFFYYFNANGHRVFNSNNILQQLWLLVVVVVGMVFYDHTCALFRRLQIFKMARLQLYAP